MQYIEYARKQRSYKKLSQIFTRVLRLHPSKADLWIYAAGYAIEEHADMTMARDYMQRGLRFCKGSKNLWIEYGKLEMGYIAKIAARRRILGIDGSEPSEFPEDQGPDTFEDPNADVIALPVVTGEDVNPSIQSSDPEKSDQVALDNLSSTPALSGAIPIAIFDEAMKHFPADDTFGYSFWRMVIQFDDLPCLKTILSHIVNLMLTAMPASPLSQACDIRLPVIGIASNDPAFPRALGEVLEKLKTHMKSGPKPKLILETLTWMLPPTVMVNIDEGLRTVLKATAKGQIRVFVEAMDQGIFVSKDDQASMFKLMAIHGFTEEAERVAGT